MQGHCVLLQIGIEGRGRLSDTSFLALGGAFGKDGCMVVGLGVAGLNLLGAALFLFSAALSFLMLGLVMLHLGIYIYYYMEIMLLFDIMFKY